MTDDVNGAIAQRRLLARAVGIMVCQAAVVLVVGGIGVILILQNLGNGIKGAKLVWFLITNPSKLLSIGMLVGVPVWEVLAMASVVLGGVLVYEIVRLMRRPLSGDMQWMKKIALGCFLVIAAPLLAFLADTGQWWVMKHAFDFDTKMYVLTGAQNDYERWFRKTSTSWLTGSTISEPEVHRDLLAGFRSYFRGDELERLEDDIAARTRKVDWWHVEYPDLIAFIQRSPHRAVATTYRAGSTGNSEGQLKASIGRDGGVVLQLVLGMDKPLADQLRTTQVTTVVRDNDRDGTPDEFQTIPALEWGYDGPVTLDGFIPLQRKARFEIVYGLWSQAVGYAVNVFLHGYDSALPRGFTPDVEQDA